MGFIPARFGRGSPALRFPKWGQNSPLRPEKTKNVSAAQSDPAILDVASMMEYQC